MSGHTQGDSPKSVGSARKTCAEIITFAANVMGVLSFVVFAVVALGATIVLVLAVVDGEWGRAGYAVVAGYAGAMVAQTIIGLLGYGLERLAGTVDARYGPDARLSALAAQLDETEQPRTDEEWAQIAEFDRELGYTDTP